MVMLHFPAWKKLLVWVVCIAGLVLALPNVLPRQWAENAPRMTLGLDLQGGSYLLLKVDFEAYVQEQLTGLQDEVRRLLREKKIGYQMLDTRDRAITFSLRVPSEVTAAEEALEELPSGLQVDISDNGSARITYDEATTETLKRSVLEQTIEIVRRRIDEFGTREPVIQQQGEDRVLLQVPGLQDPERLKSLLGQTAKMTFHLMDEANPFPSTQMPAPPGSMLLRGDKTEDASGGRYYLVKRRVMLSGDLLVDSAATYDAGRPVVSFKFNTLGGRKFGEVTKENVGKPFAIVLDNKVISAPVINEPIPGGQGIISGSFSVQQAQDLALLLRAGALPAPLSILEERTVGPSLGQDSIEAGLVASAIGIILVMAFMMYFYPRWGIIANLALVMNLVLLMGVLSLFHATLTLPGIAGIILTLGMAVDSNVLIFERVKEEISVGRSPFAAVEQGFAQAFGTILDSNITTLIATFLLFAYGSGAVKGFAVTLSVGIICSMFTAILFTRMLIFAWVKNKRPATLKI